MVSDKLADKFYELYEKDNIKRRKLIRAIFNSMTSPLKQIELFYSFHRPLGYRKDFKWVLNQAIEEDDDNKKRAWTILARYYFDISNVKDIDTLIMFSMKEKVIYDEFSSYLKPIKINSVQAKRDKNNYNKYLKPRNWEAKKDLYKLDYKENLIKLLWKLKEGKLDALWQLFRQLVYDPEKQTNQIEEYSDVINYKGWQILSIEEKDLIVYYSKKYLYEIDPKTEKWFGINNFYRPAAAGYKIIRLLNDYDLEFIKNLPIEILKKWAPIIISYPEYFGTGVDDYPKIIIKFFYDKIPNEMLILLKKLIDIGSQKDERIWIIKKFEYCWDDNVNEIIHDKIIEEDLQMNCFISLISELFNRKYKPTIDFSLDKYLNHFSNDKLKYEKSKVVCKELIYNCLRETWNTLWKIIKTNENFGKELLLNIAYEREDEKKFLMELSELELTELFIWLEEKFPEKNFEKPENYHFVDPREEIENFKFKIINELNQRGNSNALALIIQIKLNFPKLTWLDRIIYESKIIIRQKNWIPLKPIELLTLLEDKNLRFVSDENDLVNIILESLSKLNIEMHGTTPTVKFIWNSEPIKPRSEGDLSDFVKLHLQKDLSKIVVNREVEIRPTVGKSKGENTDLLVQTFVKSNNDFISVIVEVKGSWNRNLKTDMNNQLKSRYLKNNQCRYGIYLVGWFLCDSWDKRDYRFKQNPKMEIENVKKFFNKQAANLTDKEYYIYSYILDCKLNS